MPNPSQPPGPGPTPPPKYQQQPAGLLGMAQQPLTQARCQLWSYATGTGSRSAQAHIGELWGSLRVWRQHPTAHAAGPWRRQRSALLGLPGSELLLQRVEAFLLAHAQGSPAMSACAHADACSLVACLFRDFFGVLWADACAALTHHAPPASLPADLLQLSLPLCAELLLAAQSLNPCLLSFVGPAGAP